MAQSIRMGVGVRVPKGNCLFALIGAVLLPEGGNLEQFVLRYLLLEELDSGLSWELLHCEEMRQQKASE